MAIPGPSTPQPSLSWRQVQSHLRNVVLANPIRDVDSLLDVLLPTLHILDLVPSPPALPVHIAQRRTPQRVFGKLIHGRPLEEDALLGGGDQDGEDEEEWLRAFRSQTWLGDVQRTLLVGSIAETWDHEMREREPEMWEALRRAWFVPPTAKEPAAAADSAPSSSKMIIMEGSEEQDAVQQAKRRQSAAAMTLSGLQALSSALSMLASRTASSSTRTSNWRPNNLLLSSTLQVAHWYSTTPGLLDLLLEGARMQGNAAKRTLVWGEVVKILASLQDRMANAAGGHEQQTGVAGFARAWSKSLLCQLVAKLLAVQGDKADLPLLAELLTKLIRTNPQLLTSSSAKDDDHVCFWATLLRQLISVSSLPGLRFPAQVQKRWPLFLSHLDTRDRQNVDLSLAHFLHRRFLHIEVVDAAKERGRPAAVGKAFLSSETAQRIELGARLLEVLWGSTTAAGASTNPKEGGQNSSDEDEDDEEDHFTHLLTQIILPSHRISSALLWSAGMARAFVCYVAGSSSSKAQSTTERLQIVLTRAVEQWGNADRVRRTTVKEEHYFVALILGVLAELSGSGSNSSDTSRSQPGLSTSRSGTFIHGVGSHLEHPDPEVRRMGMLLAEVVSEVAHTEQQGAGEAKEGKPLSFGSSMWDGVGEGREEARVLRALWYGWGMTRDGGRKGLKEMKGERVLEMLGLKEQPETLVQQGNAVVATKSGLRQAPRTRQLPQRVPARPDDAATQSKAGGRSLIVDLDDENKGEVAGGPRLDQASSRPSKIRPVASVESDNDDSSSESGSSSDEEAHEPLSIDADLTPGAPSPLPGAKKKAAAAAPEDGQDELLGLGIDKKKRRPPPVYISDLTAMLRDHKERDSIRLALKHGEELLRRKGQLAASASTSTSSTALAAFSTLSIGTGSSGSRGPRGEIDEHCIDLLLQLCALQNNYRIHSFEPRRRAMLRCLVIWAPRIAVPALVEQIFAPGYSITQRLGMLEALGWGARELCGLECGVVEGMKGWTDEAIGRARKEGEERVPEIKRERDLQRLTDVGAGGGRTRMLRRPQEGGRAGIQEIGTSTNGQSTVQRLPSRYSTHRLATTSMSASATPPLSSSLFIFPLLTRLRSHLSDASSRLSRARHISTFTHNSTNPSSLNLATPDLFTASPPLLLPAILDTLALLTTTYVQEQRPTPLDAHGVVLPEMLEVATHVIREGLPLLAFAARDDQSGQGGKGGEGGEDSGNVVAAISSLILVTLDLALESPSAEASRLLVATERGAAALDDALRFASGVFESEDAKSGLGGGKGVGMGISRTGRMCAAIVVRIEELRQRERERWLGGLGMR